MMGKRKNEMRHAITDKLKQHGDIIAISTVVIIMVIGIIVLALSAEHRKEQDALKVMSVVKYDDILYVIAQIYPEQFNPEAVNITDMGYGRWIVQPYKGAAAQTWICHVEISNDAYKNREVICFDDN